MPSIKVLIVDDAIVIRRLVSDTINGDPDLEVIGTAANGKIGLAKIGQLNPDVVTLDVEMPEMDGLETLIELRKLYPNLPVVMFSTLTARGSEITIEALARGASDYVAKPANVGSMSEAVAQLRDELIPKLKALVPGRAPAVDRVAPRPVASAKSPAPVATAPIDAVVLGTSTGGPAALETTFTAMTEPLSVPTFVVQHIPETFSRLLAERLDRVSPFTVVEGEDGMRAEPGFVYIAPGGRHMTIARRGNDVIVHTDDSPPVNSCRPAVDVLFQSAVDVYGGNQLGVILTGMGRDGLIGCEALSEQGARILVQDESSSVVWGMPGYVAERGIADEILPLDQMGQRIARIVGASTPTRAGAMR